MRIAYVVHDYHYAGGHSRYVAELANRLSLDHEVHVFANNIVRDRPSNVTFHRVAAARRNALTTVLTFAASVPHSWKGFDVVHSQGYCGTRCNVITAHICGKAWHEALRGFAGGLTWRERIFDVVTARLERDLYRQSAAEVIAISNLVAEDLRSHYECSARIHVLPHGVDLETFSPATRSRFRDCRRAEVNVSSDEFLFIYVGDLRKGATQCLRALALCGGRGRLIIVSRSDARSFRAEADRLGIAAQVEFLPFTSHIQEFYAAADALILPSPYDTFAMVVTEAMATGLPVVVSRTAGASELITHGTDGLILDDAADVAQLSHYMRRLIEESPLRERLGRAARATVERFSWDEITRRTLDVYRVAPRMVQ